MNDLGIEIEIKKSEQNINLPQVATVITPSVIIRDKASSEGVVLGYLHEGQVIRLVDKSNLPMILDDKKYYWYKIDYQKKGLWVLSSNLEFINPDIEKNLTVISNASLVTPSDYINPQQKKNEKEHVFINKPFSAIFNNNNLYIKHSDWESLTNISLMSPSHESFNTNINDIELTKINPRGASTYHDMSSSIVEDVFFISLYLANRFDSGEWRVKLEGINTKDIPIEIKSSGFWYTSEAYFSPFYKPIKPKTINNEIKTYYLYYQGEESQIITKVLYAQSRDEDFNYTYIPALAFTFDYKAGTIWKGVLTIGYDIPDGLYVFGDESSVSFGRQITVKRK